MPRPVLPAPNAQGIYTFPVDLERAHHEHLASLDAHRRNGDPTIIDLTAAHSGARYPIAQRQPTGRHVVVIEPHQDDFALSASGRFLADPAPLTVITVFSRSQSVDPRLKDRYPTVDEVSAIRAREGQETLRPLQAEQHLLGHQDANPPYRPFDTCRLTQITEELRALLAHNPDAEIIAPAGVTRHPDHLLVHEAARHIGCRLFWDDSAFWATYALSADDRHLFDMRVGATLVPELVDITEVTLDKLTLLHMHGSQMDEVREMYRPMRYAWTTAASLPERQQNPDAPYFAERYYRLEPR